MKNRLIADRVKDAGKVFRGPYSIEPEGEQTALVDLLADLMHWARVMGDDENGMDFDDALDTARMHVDAEIVEEAEVTR
jgi:hypothetical protein